MSKGFRVFVTGLLVLVGAGGWSWRAAHSEAEDRVSEASLTVSLSAKTLEVSLDGEVVRSYGVAIQTPRHPTPRGTYTIGRIIWNPAWVPPDSEWARDKEPQPPGSPDNPMGRVKIFFREPDYYIHGTRDEGSVGTAASHGCLRMTNDDIIDLAKFVMEQGGAERPESWFRRVLNRLRDTQEVRLAMPVAMTVTD